MSYLVIHYVTLILLFHLTYAQTEINQDENFIPASKQKVNDVVEKINNIVRDIQSKSLHENINEILKNVELKLMKAAKSLGSKGKKNVELIMEGIRIKTSNITHNARKSKNTRNKNNKKVLEDLSRKFDLFVKNKLNKSGTKNKNILNNDIKLTEYVFSWNSTNKEKNVVNDTRRAEKLFPKDDGNDVSQIKQEDTNIDIDDLNTENPKSFTASVEVCNDIFTRICSKIQLLNSFKCQYVDSSVRLEDLCNNLIDCPDRSDEKYCTRHATNKVEEANRVMADVEASYSHRCFEIDDKTSFLKKQSQVLQNVLMSQINFKEKYQNLRLTLNADGPDFSNTSDSKTVKRIANEIALTISSLALTLNGALCPQLLANRRSFDDIFQINVEQEFKKVLWPPKSCECKRELCIGCSDTCKGVCWHKYSLTRWNCESLNITDSVSLNALCDGKVDCFDESDEKECDVGTGFAKFEAHEIYSSTIKMLQSRASKQTPSLRNKILSLSNLVTKLQEITTQAGSDRSLVLKLRTKCYSLISSLYLDMVEQSHFVSESEEAFLFLQSINKNLAAALKRSSTGNKKNINDGCYCRNGLCAVSLCPRSCIKSCAAESKIINFRCQGDNFSVSISKICDGVPDCPSGYDEAGCQKDEVCRQHHLIVLRRRLQDVEKKFKGTSLGEILGSWKTKVISILKIAEASGRPKPKILRKIIKDILRDLVLTYGSVEDYRRSNTDYALEDFKTIAQQVMNILKACGK